MNRLPLDLSNLRRKAEQVARERGLPSEALLDPVRLVHELQIHQIELELQNNELVAAVRDLDALRAKYQAIYESAPVGYVMLTRTGYAVECNAMALRMLESPAEAVLRRPLRDRFAAQSRPEFDALLSGAAKSGSSSANEMLVQRPRQLPMYVRAQTRMLQVPHHDGKLFLFVMMDVSALKYAFDDIERIVTQRDNENPV